MTGQRPGCRLYGWPLAIVSCLAVAAWGVWHGVSGWPSIATHLRDDAFYQFTWACNLVRIGQPMVSDGTTTSGVQLLWSVLLAWFAGGQPQAIERFAVVAGVSCHLLAALSWVWATRGRSGGICLALLWLGNPLLLRECQNGQETALACLFAVLLWHARHARERWFAPLLCLAVLARSDLWAVGALLSLARHRRRWPAGVPAPALALAVHIAPNLALGGGMLQDSASPIPWLVHANFELTVPTGSEWLGQEWWFGRPALLGAPFALAGVIGLGTAVFGLIRPWLPARWSWVPMIVVGLAWLLGGSDLSVPATAALLLAWRPRAARRPVPWLLLALIVGLAAIVVLHWVVRWYPRDYYLAPLVVGALAALQAVRRSAAWLILAGAVQALTVTAVQPEPLRHQLAMDMAGRYLRELLPAGERVGCFNAGLLTFRQLSGFDGREPLRIVNLDGVVDARAFAALRQRRLGEWLASEQVHYVVDHPVQFALDPKLPHACGHWFGEQRPELHELARFIVPGVDAGRARTGDFRLYAIGESSSPPMPEAPRQLGVVDGGVVVLWPARAGAVLEVQARDGRRQELVTAVSDSVVVVLVAKERLGAGLVFERGAGEPLLELSVPGR